MNEIKIIKSQKNKKQFLINNYIFEINKKTVCHIQETFYTRCVMQRINKCKATYVLL